MMYKDPNQSIARSHIWPLPRDLCFPGEKALFRKWAVGKKNLVEIGVFEGCSASLFRKMMDPNGILHLIDPYIPDNMNPNLIARTWMAKLNVGRVRNGHVRWYRDYSFNVVKRWNKPIDFLFMDGDHVEAHVQRDWSHWAPFVEVGGVVLFHDARQGLGDGHYWDGWPGPTAVVNKLFRGPNRLDNWEVVGEAVTVVAVRRRA